MCKVLENRAQQDEERMDQLTNQLKEARLLAEDADGKSDEVSRKLAFVEDELEVAEDRVKSGEAKIMELEEELKVSDNDYFNGYFEFKHLQPTSSVMLATRWR
jgi:chromosome segregation ATPase